MREFLQSRPMVPYKEAWMGQVDTMKTLQGWSDVTVTHFRDLGVYGEQILLSIRYGDWIDVNDENSAKNWARYWRPEIQGYLHAYRAVTGVDLTNPDRRRLHDAGRALAEAAGHATDALRCARARLHLGALSRAAPPEFVAAPMVAAHDGKARHPGAATARSEPRAASLRRSRASNAQRSRLRHCTCSGICSACSHASR